MALYTRAYDPSYYTPSLIIFDPGHYMSLLATLRFALSDFWLFLEFCPTIHDRHFQPNDWENFRDLDNAPDRV